MSIFAKKTRILSRWDDSLIWESEHATIRRAVEAAVKSHASLSGASLYGANLYGASLSGASLYGANLSGASLSGASLYGANLSGASLSGADLSGANLSCANLYGASLSGASLSGADLSGANLSGASLSRASLSRASLSGANLSGANLSGANLSGAVGVNPLLTTPLYALRDQPGAIRLYKLVDANGESPIQQSTKMSYRIGESVECPDANTDETVQCAAGINVATLDWCLREWRTGWRVLVVEFTAADIAAIPIASDGKLRLHRCTVVGEKDLAEILA